LEPRTFDKLQYEFNSIQFEKHRLKVLENKALGGGGGGVRIVGALGGRGGNIKASRR